VDVQHGQTRVLWELAAGLVSFRSFSADRVRLSHAIWLTAFFTFCSSQAMDVGTLKGLPADTIRILVWILSFLSFGYATAEFEVTADRLGVYRPEEHIE
jgi:hypothetical protein